MSYTKLLYHIVIITYKRQLTIFENHERELHMFMMEICANREVKVYRIGGMPDHVHLLVGIPPSLALSKFVQELKAISSGWLKKNPHFPAFVHWSKEFAAFSYSIRDKDMIANYIRNQKSHHHTKTFEEEYRKFLQENGIKIDESTFLMD
ncbi:MAG: IS200/IS605 family transposase [Bacteroidales bacterium]|nr:IS200/IS605 family transposase [Bacteroidales bacterium]